MTTELGTFWFCDEHGWAGTDEEPSNCCSNRYSMGWYETKKEQEARLETSAVSGE